MLTDNEIEEKLGAVGFKTSEELDRRIRIDVFSTRLDGPICDCTAAESTGRIGDPVLNTPNCSHDSERARSTGRWQLTEMVNRVAALIGGVLLNQTNTKPHCPKGMSMTTKIAARVLLLAGAVGLAVMLVNPGTSVVLANVVRESTQAKSVTFVLKVNYGNMAVLDIKGLLQGDELRCELPNGIVYVETAKERKGLFLDLQNKEAARYDFPKDATSLWNTHPIQWLQQVKPDDAKWLGNETLEGGDAEVFLSKQIGLFTNGTKSYGFAPEHTSKIWVDRHTELPLKLVISDHQGNDFMTFTQMKWNETLGSDLFVLDVPEGFTVQTIESFHSRFPQLIGR